MGKKETFEIYSKHSNRNIIILIIGGCIGLSFVLIAFFLSKSLFVKLIIFGNFILILSGFLFFTFHMTKPKSIRIDDNGVQYIFNGKIKKEIRWGKVYRVLAWAKGKYWGINLQTDRGELAFTNGLESLSNLDIVRAFKKIKEYQKKYNFEIKDEAGFDKIKIGPRIKLPDVIKEELDPGEKTAIALTIAHVGAPFLFLIWIFMISEGHINNIDSLMDLIGITLFILITLITIITIFLGLMEKPYTFFFLLFSIGIMVIILAISLIFIENDISIGSNALIIGILICLLSYSFKNHLIVNKVNNVYKPPGERIEK